MRSNLISFFNRIANMFDLVVTPKRQVYLPWPTSFSTVDVAIVDLENDKILLGRKKDRWCIIGGFTDPSSNRDVEDAVRELYEETKLVASVDELEYIGDIKIEDARYNNTGHGIRTHFFMLNVNHRKVTPIASDDIDEVCWFSLKDRFELLNRHDSYIQSSHRVLLHMLKNYIERNTTC